MEPGFSLVQCPDLQLMSQGPEPCLGKMVSEFGYRCWHTAQYFVSSDARKDNATPLCGYVGYKRFSSLSRRSNGPGSRSEGIGVKSKLEEVLQANIDVTTDSATLFFYLRKIRAF